MGIVGAVSPGDHVETSDAQQSKTGNHDTGDRPTLERDVHSVGQALAGGRRHTHVSVHGNFHPQETGETGTNQTDQEADCRHRSRGLPRGRRTR